jgi:hypothetical protein
MKPMSYSFRNLLRSLLEAATQTTSPCFTVSQLNGISADGFDILRREKVLVKACVPEEMYHYEHGHVAIRKTTLGFHLVSLSDTASEWVKVEAAQVERYRFSHQGMARWIAKHCRTEDEVCLQGPIWTIGRMAIHGKLCRILYYPGPASMERLLAEIRSIEFNDTGMQYVIILPFTLSITTNESSRLEKQGMFVENLYSITNAGGIDVEMIRLPNLVHTIKPGYFFRRVDGNKSWEIGFNTAKTTPLPRGVAMDRIWLLLRNPGKEFRASDITDELCGVSSDRSKDKCQIASGASITRSTGSRSRSIADLAPTEKREGAELYRELGRIREEYGEDSMDFREAQDEWKSFQARYGLADTFGGKVKRENDDTAKETGTIKKSIDRWIRERRDAGMIELANHLDAAITRGQIFKYSPDNLPPWQT